MGLRVVIVHIFESIVLRTPNADASLRYFTVLLVRCLQKFSLMQQGSCDALNILIQRTLRRSRSMNRGRYCPKSVRPWFTTNVKISAPYMFPRCVTKEYSFASRAQIWYIWYSILKKVDSPSRDIWYFHLSHGNNNWQTHKNKIEWYLSCDFHTKKWNKNDF